MEDLLKLKEIYLSDVDSETYQENLEEIEAWEKDLFSNENFASWQDHPVTKDMADKASAAYLEISKTLATRRNLTEAERLSLWARQDACLLMVSWSQGDPKRAIEELKDKIKHALDAA